jgi:hydrogenase assembly chaperone HypC/HupF
MCIAFPGLVVRVDDSGAVVETEGRRRHASTLYMPGIAVGDWVMVAAGTIVGRLEPEEAAQIRNLVMTATRQRRVEEGASDVHAT